jgi:hypothetical protein
MNLRLELQGSMGMSLGSMGMSQSSMGMSLRVVWE